MLQQRLVGRGHKKCGVPRLLQPAVRPRVRRPKDVDVGRPARHFGLDERLYPLGEVDPLGRVLPQIRVVDARGLRDKGGSPAGGEFEDLCGCG